MGHLYGFGSEMYKKQISKINGYVETVISHLKDKGVYDNTYIILTTDHGAQFNTTWHGEWNDENIHIPWYIVGPNVKKGYQINRFVRNADTPSTILDIFGYPPNENWRGVSVAEVFTSSNLKNYSLNITNSSELRFLYSPK